MPHKLSLRFFQQDIAGLVTISLQNAFPTHIWIWYDLEALQSNDEITKMHFVDVLAEIRFRSQDESRPIQSL